MIPANPEGTPAGRRESVALEGLNPAQREAVLHPGGPLLVLAGAGSGKTRVITHRIAHLVLDRGEPAEGIVAVTFTNKAAAEMRERVARLLGGPPEGAWIGTFHAYCLRLLRREGQQVGLAPGFAVYDTDDQVAVVRRILREMELPDAAPAARTHLARISWAKNALLTPEAYEAQAYSPDVRSTARIFHRYREALRRANAVDFDDLLLLALELLDGARRPEILARHAGRCRHLLVDEYQDTNRPQYLLLRALASVHGNLFVVGDEDQSIYAFRGADLRNILDFERDHPGARVVKLEENYRSTGTILHAAGAVISRNTLRKGKSLWTGNPRGEPVVLCRADDDRAEAEWVAGEIRALHPELPYEEIAVLYRTNAQSRPFEEIFRRERIPHQVVGAVRFYERREVKDVLAYLKLLANPADDAAFRRAAATPPRGIGEATLGAVEEAARAFGSSLLDAAARAIEHGLVGGRSARALREFLALLDELRALAGELPLVGLLGTLLDRIGYEAHLERTYPEEGADRMDNVRALVSAAAEHERETPDASLQTFLDRSALVSEADEVGVRPGVTLMTAHCAKGLEFRAVFVAGLEEGLLPHARSAGDRSALEEERRLFYVAMTRARERLMLSRADTRLSQGVPVPCQASRFLGELPAAAVREVSAGASWASLGEPRGRRGAAGREGWGSSAARAAARSAREAPPAIVPSEDTGDGLRPGAWIRHPQFGAGRILEREGSGRGLKLTIHFSAGGRKKILPAFTRLEVVQE